jgi:Undecaprenyl-phosphate galactose phosphotransferase WbaP
MSALGLVAADVAAWGVSVAVVYLVRTLVWGTHPVLWVLWVVGGVWIFFRAAAGLYRPLGISPSEEVRRSFRTTQAVVLTHLAVLLALREVAGWRLAGLLVWPTAFPLAWFTRSLAKTLLIRARLYGTPFVVVGTGEKARRAIREMCSNPDMGFVPVAAFGDAPETWGREVEGVPVLGPPEMAAAYPYPYPVGNAMLALSRREADAERIVELANGLVKRFPTLDIFPDLIGLANLWTKPRLVGAYMALQTRHPRFSARQRVAKRAFDLAMGLPVFLAALPVIAVAAALVKVISPGPAFFSQTREGVDGEQVRIWKIRTMVPGAEERLADYLASDPAAWFEWERTLKLRHDPRVIPVIGSFLRRSSIDELPQLWTVIRGDMSLVGPRIMERHEVERYTGRGRDLRREVPPGLTGLWQINFRNNSDLHIREVADSYYIQNWSVWLDLWILFRTVRVVVAGAGAY